MVITFYIVQRLVLIRESNDTITLILPSTSKVFADNLQMAQGMLLVIT